MGFFSDLFKFENHFSVNFFKDIKKDPSRLLTGVDPFSTKAWNAVTGSDKKPLVNMFGSPGEQYYESAKAKGINTGAATDFHAVADMVAAFYGAQGIAGIGGGSSGSTSSSGSGWGDTIGDFFKSSNSSGGNRVATSSQSSSSNWLSKIGDVMETFKSQDIEPTKIESSTSSTSYASVTKSPSPSSYEMTFGGMADQYAKQYGIPTDIFRSAIRRVSDFDPGYSDDANRKGIAGLSMSSNNKSLDPYDLDTSFKSAALLMKETYEKTKNWGLSEESFVSNEEINPETIRMIKEREEIVDAAETERAGKPIWEYSPDDFKAYLVKSAWPILFIIVGAVLIIASLYVVIVKGGDK
jgi:hypothetical protein